jgi:flagellar biosynthetic protein FlhB
MLLAGLLALQYGSRGVVEFFAVFARDQFGRQPWMQTSAEEVIAQCRQIMEAVGQSLWPLFALIFAVSILAHLGQTGFLFLPRRALPQGSRVNPMRSLQKLISANHLAGVAFGLLKAILIVAVVAGSLWNAWNRWIAVGSLSPLATAGVMVELVLAIGVRIAAALLLLGVVDYLWQRYRFEQGLRMSSEELREELRQQQSDSQLARRRRQRQRVSAQRRAA